MILQKSFSWDPLKKHFLLLSRLKTVILLNIFVETNCFAWDALMKRKLKGILQDLALSIVLVENL